MSAFAQELGGATSRPRAKRASPSNTVAIRLYPGGCTTEQFGVGACAFVSEGSAPGKTAESRLSLYSAPQAYVLGIQNLGPGDEAGAFQVVLNR